VTTRPSSGRPSWIAGVFPGYFALVMATGIVAIGSKQQDIGWLADVLYLVAAIAFGVLVVVFAARLILFAPRFVADLTSHARGFTFLTIVAATNVLGSGSALIHGWWTLAEVLWWCGLLVYPILLYTALVAVVIRADKPALGAGINGSWFLLTVSTESIAVLGALLLGHDPDEFLAFVCLAVFGLGLVLYLVVMTMLFLRWTFQPLDPTEADPPSWIAAGAVAITVLAGSNLLVARGVSPRIEELAPFLEGTVILSWATATFWFPVMVSIGVWRHIVRRVPLRYHPSYWAVVFPLGMYGVATFRMRVAVALDELSWLPKLTLGVALLAWTVTFVGMVAPLARRVRGPDSHRSNDTNPAHERVD
jgi:tellurite resistance protein TehA-like permease